MRTVVVDKIASVTQACGLSHEVRVSAGHSRRGRRGRGRRGADQQVHLQHARAHQRPHGQGRQGRHRRRARSAIARRCSAIRATCPRAVKPGDIMQMLNIGGVLGIVRLGESRQGQAVRLPRASAACCISRISASASACRRASAIASSTSTRSSTRSGVPVVALAGTCMEAGKTAAAVRHHHAACAIAASSSMRSRPRASRCAATSWRWKMPARATR